MRIAWLLPDLTLSGGAGIVIQHARRLAADHGMEGTVVLTRPGDEPAWAYPGLEELRVATLDEVAGEAFDVAVATWWETALDLFAVGAERHAYFVQLLEDSHYRPGEAEPLGFQLTLGLPVRFITASSWITQTVESLQPGNRAFYVLSGMDKETWSVPDAVPAGGGDGPLRVIVEGGLDLVRKGVPHALEAVRLMRAADTNVTLVTPRAPEADAAVPESVDVHVGGLSHAELAQAFSESHVLLKLSRAEGMYGPPLEAFHKGCTCVTNPVTGHLEYIRHGENALVVDWDDPTGTARALDLLARDRALLERLRAGALETARAWPDWGAASAEMAEVMRAIVAEPPPPPSASGGRAAAGARAVLAHAELAQTRDRDSTAAYEALRSQKAVRAALRARRVLVRARSLRTRLGR